MKSIKIFAPATVANLSCGFDVLGLALDTIGDEMIFSTNKSGKLRITKITGAKLPSNIKENIVGVVAEAMLKKANATIGVDIEIHKKIKPGSGIGSSAASGAGTAFGINHILGNIFNKKQEIEFAMLGEKLVGGALVADNVAPAILGGITLIKSYQPFEFYTLPIPANLYVVIAHPQIELKTIDARKILPQKVKLTTAIKQAANMGAFVHALHTQDYNLMGKALQDTLVEPHRKTLIPLFDEAKTTAKNAGALSSGISGAGPSMFHFCEGQKTATKVETALQKLYKHQGLDTHVFSSAINKKGIKIL